METLSGSLDEKTWLILSTNSELLKFLKSDGAARPGSRGSISQTLLIISCQRRGNEELPPRRQPVEHPNSSPMSANRRWRNGC